VQPTIFYFNNAQSSQVHLKINPAVSARVALPKIKDAITTVSPSAFFDYKFVDEEYGQKFIQEQRIGTLASLFSILAIAISCLGLFGLASFIAEQRTKEIGIRKVLGASILGLWKLLAKDFVVLVIISCFIAIPIGYYLMHQWLQKYEYHTPIPLWILLLSCVSATGITLLTVSYQSIKAATMNPVNSLRTE
jgi:ABC-type antimicrobial peptide transport system permease subunit